MRIINTTRNTVLANEVAIADTALGRMKGLLGRKSLQAGRALVINPCNSIHTLFMRFSIDVLFLDKDSRVVKSVSFIKPFRFSPIYFSACMVIEFPAGTIQATRTQEGDIISIA